MRAADGEPMLSVLARRRNRRKAVELARLLVAIDTMAADARPWRPRRSQRVSLGPGR
jgi:hypothetical protein